MIDQFKALQIAAKYSDELGYNTSLMKAKIEKYNIPKNRYLNDDSEYSMVRRKLLEGKIYWTVYFTPKKKKGGDICVFIDEKTGEIISNIRGK